MDETSPSPERDSSHTLQAIPHEPHRVQTKAVMYLQVTLHRLLLRGGRLRRRVPDRHGDGERE